MDENVDISVKDIPERTVLFLQCRGSWRQLPLMIEKLNKYVEKALVETTGPVSGIYYNKPGEVDVENLEWEVFYAIKESGSAEPSIDEKEFGLKILPKIMVASAIHKGSYRKVSSTYERLERWIIRNGYNISGLPREEYLSVFGVPGDDQIMEIHIPVNIK
jgi:effector-binding domain-containing protein